jgi:ABC-type branched-subunit amino acid transport system substrate-binding protein
MLIGATTSTTTIPVAGVAEAYKVPFLIPSATNDLITGHGHNWVFRICTPSQEFARQGFGFLEDRARVDADLSVTTMAIVYEDSDFGNATAVAAAMQAAERGIRVVAYERFERGRESETRHMLDRIKSQSPQALFFAINYPDDAATLIRLSRCEGLQPQLIIAGEGGFADPRFLETAGPLAEGVLVITQWDEGVTWDGACGFAADYRREYGDDGRAVPMLSAEAYAAMHTAYEAVRQALYKDSDRTPPPMPPLPECAPAPTPQPCTPLPLSAACTLVPTPPAFTPTAAPISTPACAPVRAAAQDRCLETTAIRDALTTMGAERPLETVFGPIAFDAAGQNGHTVLITQVQCGRLEIVGPPAHQTKDYQSSDSQ